MAIDGVSIGGPEHRRLTQQMVRYVPQGNDLLPSLTVRETFTFGARVRLARDVPRDGREEVIQRVLTQLNLTDRADAKVSSLSGGECRRVSIGLELLASPRLLLLDEPTSGLDQGKDRQLMKVLKSVASNGCTVLCVTHSVDNLWLATSLMIMAPKGNIAYLGKPLAALEALGSNSWPAAMDALVDDPMRYGDAFRLSQAAQSGGAAVPAGDTVSAAGPTSLSGLGSLVYRQLIVTARRGGPSLAALAALPLVGMLLAVMASRHGLAPGPKATAVLVIATTVAALAGISLTYIDLLSELPALKRDWRVGVSSFTVVFSKAIVFTVMSVMLSSIMVAVFGLIRGLPSVGLKSVSSLEAVALPWTAVVIGSMALGLFLSAIAPTLERAVTLAAGATLLQVVFNGTVFELSRKLGIIAGALPARSGLASLAAWLGLNAMRPGLYHDALWYQSAGHFWGPLAFLVCLAFGYIVAAGVLLERRWRQSE
jgi:ABC-type lipoprotein export system ATPase subunit